LFLTKLFTLRIIYTLMETGTNIKRFRELKEVYENLVQKQQEEIDFFKRSFYLKSKFLQITIL